MKKIQVELKGIELFLNMQRMNLVHLLIWKMIRGKDNNPTFAKKESTEMFFILFGFLKQKSFQQTQVDQAKKHHY